MSSYEYIMFIRVHCVDAVGHQCFETEAVWQYFMLTSIAAFGPLVVSEQKKQAEKLKAKEQEQIQKFTAKVKNYCDINDW